MVKIIHNESIIYVVDEALDNLKRFNNVRSCEEAAGEAKNLSESVLDLLTELSKVNEIAREKLNEFLAETKATEERLERIKRKYNINM